MDFVVAGVPKCGTSWIDYALRSVIPLSLPQHSKETFYLDRHFNLGAEWHRGLYDTQADRIGEVSPSYFSKKYVVERLKALSPGCRIIIALRNPYDRAVSALLHRSRRGEFSTVEEISGISEDTWRAVRRYCAYADCGEWWLSAFGSEQVLFVAYDDIRADPAGSLNRILCHAGFSEQINDEAAAGLSARMVFENAAPRSKTLVRMSRLVTQSLQRVGFTSVAGALQRSPARKLLEKSGHQNRGLRAALDQHVRTQENFEAHIDSAENVLNRDLQHWRSAFQAAEPPGAADGIGCSA